MIELILEESKWFAFAMSTAMLGVALWLFLRRRSGPLEARPTVASALNLFYGIVIGLMGFGHLLAVALKIGMGSIESSVHPILLLLLGLILAVPGGWLAVVAARNDAESTPPSRRSWLLNAWLCTALLALGPQNLPLAAPAALNLAYAFHKRRWAGWVIAGAAALAHLGLFVGSLLFLASGGSFEQFSGME